MIQASSLIVQGEDCADVRASSRVRELAANRLLELLSARRVNRFGNRFWILWLVLFSGFPSESPAQVSTGEVRLAWAKSSDIVNGRLAVDAGGSICIAGSKDSPIGGGVHDAATRKLSANGDVIWSAIYHDPNGYSASLTDLGLDSAGNVYTAGPVFTACPFFQCFAELVLKYNAQGNLQSNYQLQPRSKTYASAFVVTPSGNVCIVGRAEMLEIPPPAIGYVYYTPVGWLMQGEGVAVSTAGSDRDSNLYLAGGGIYKYSPTGSLIWSNSLAGAGGNVVVGPSGGVYVSSYTNLYDPWLALKYSNQGALLWQRPSIPGGHVSVDSQENVIVAGVTNIGSDWNLVITKYGSDGSVLWTRSRLYNNNRLYLSDWRIDTNNAIYVSGTVETNSNPSRYISLLKYSSEGDLQWEIKYARAGYRYNDALGMAIDSESNIYLSGSTSSTGATNEYVILKYEQGSAAARLSVRHGVTPADPLVLSLFAKAGRLYRIDSSTDLLQWEPYTNISNAFGTVETILPVSTLAERRFYRAVFVSP